MVGYILGMESTAHTFGVAVVSLEGEILSNVKDSYSAESGGMIPLEVRAHHARVSGELYSLALEEAGVKESEIVCVAFSNAPGLAPCLLEGMEFVKRVAGRLGVPVVCVNHCVAHLEIGESVGAKDPVMLYVSGANTQVIAYEAGKYRVFGETLDLGVGNFIDTVGRFMGLGFPAGPKIQKLAEEYVEKNSTQMNADERGFPSLIELPYSVKGMDVAFAGMQTKIRNLIEKGEDKRKIAYSMQEVVFAMLVEVAERALAHTGKSELLLGGGVACNLRLVEMCRIMCEERGVSLQTRFARETPSARETKKSGIFSRDDLAERDGVKLIVPPREFLIDNAGMIGYLGLKMFRAGLGKSVDEIDIAPRERTDEVEVSWK